VVDFRLTVFRHLSDFTGWGSVSWVNIVLKYLIDSTLSFYSISNNPQQPAGVNLSTKIPLILNAFVFNAATMRLDQ
jgi:hypothetical protein